MTREHMATALICPLTAGSIEAMRADMVRAAQCGADLVECRLDRLAQPPTEVELVSLLKDPPVDVIVTYRPTRQGGRYDGDEGPRLSLLRAAAALLGVTIDVECDVPPDQCPSAGVIRSHHDLQKTPGDIDRIASALVRRPGDVAKVAFAAGGPEDACLALDVLRAADGPAIAVAMGQAGLMSRILARKFGAFGTFAALGPGAASAPGQPTIDEFRKLYRWDSIGPATAVFGVIGCPVGHSMSPAVHNAAFSAAGFDGVYVPLLIQPGAENFSRFMDAVLARPWLDLRGLSVTIPHKENALAYVGVGNCDELAGRIGAVNTVTIDPGGSLRGDNTDYRAALDSLCGSMGIDRAGLAGMRVAVLGAGGVARAIVAALRHYGAEVSIHNRTVSRAEALAEEFGCTASGLETAGRTDAEIVVNCTSLGMHPNEEACPLASIPSSVRVVFDTVYNPIETRLLRRARRAGCRTVSGLEMFVGQASAQFEIWTDTSAPKQVMRQVVEGKLSDRELDR